MKTQDYLQSPHWFRLIFDELEGTNGPDQSRELNEALKHSSDLHSAFLTVRHHRQVMSREMWRQRAAYAAAQDEQPVTRFIPLLRNWRVAATVLVFLTAVLGALVYLNYQDQARMEAHHSQIEQYLATHLSKPSEVLLAEKTGSGEATALESARIVIGQDSFRIRDVQPFLTQLPDDARKTRAFYTGMTGLFAADGDPGQARKAFEESRSSSSYDLKLLATYYLGAVCLRQKAYSDGIGYLEDVVEDPRTSPALKEEANRLMLSVKAFGKSNESFMIRLFRKAI